MLQLIISVLVLILSLPTFAQYNASSVVESEFYYEMKDGSLYKHDENGRHKLLSRELIYNGMLVSPDGSFRRLNEKPKKLVDGQFLDINGVVHQSLARLEAQQEVHRIALDHEYFRLINGEVVHFKTGQQEIIRKEIKINQHITLYPNGIWINNEGRKFRLREGQCMDKKGKVYKNLMELHVEIEQKYLEGNP